LEASRIAITRTESDSSDGVFTISIVSVGELYDGAYGTADPPGHLVKLSTFINQFPVLSLDDLVMREFAFLRSFLRQTGQLIKDLDILIAATAIRHRRILVTRNLRHFRRVPRLEIYDL
jgi:predicted nucleic acid-binding protein